MLLMSRLLHQQCSHAIQHYSLIICVKVLFFLLYYLFISWHIYFILTHNVALVENFTLICDIMTLNGRVCIVLRNIHLCWKMCHIKCSSNKKIHDEYFPTKKTRQLPYRARGARANSYFCTYRSVWMVLYIKTCILSVNRCLRSVCIIRNNQILDVLIKYIAKYHNYFIVWPIRNSIQCNYYRFKNGAFIGLKSQTGFVT